MCLRRRNNKDEARELPKPLFEHIRKRLNLVPEYLDSLRCFEYDVTANDKKLRCIRVFSPHAAKERNLKIRTNEDLVEHPELLLFEGYLDSEGSAYVAYRKSAGEDWVD
jgi:hypothetical protein